MDHRGCGYYYHFCSCHCRLCGYYFLCNWEINDNNCYHECRNCGKQPNIEMKVENDAHVKRKKRLISAN
jgi:hypothetical protein